ncbi:putative TIR domain, P-loop containing nucleoside triphosphate hydrolase [Helianthus annuus]|uniref:Putative toll/interleukin-1 receptor (TIR) domain-containing protein n=1 Tax=Helianthus annuus TaxID=4232 RepID=A0A251TUN9_HELAN|nr:TMV resistance protein N [Helianthus annuus]KAF5789042.1 putative TIR domain, P-loop containing nucleoside triphosphate hydrolase [Helianthus annuus]KAJ0532241.1 putative TIR domain, P-loop containing nucleoside triphosphate hydrolase [Helianthus annuus]KAJ0705885.1 putative TIR domain, P-loop containing nucleoside triphosphate hydrolase [Helianthus annuus]KAJ0710015.1 putative TIR domain, P-loop containing nucleoside triphosphate hydrolase [Helianthus annuus]KAJ0891367.1 putative TIR domai
MASISSVPKSFKYDVFLSFRGEDTRKTFVDHLYHALVNKGIITYKDDETIDKGERIKEQLMRSIQDSRFYIIVFSKNYASSSWCLDELVEIIKCQKTAEHTAYPVFYDVEPTEVRHQSGAFGETFAKLVAKHEKGRGMFSFFKLFTRKRKRTSDLEKQEDVGRWRYALNEAAGLAGMELKNTVNGHEARFIQQIVKEVAQKLHFFNTSIDGKLVGMETRVTDMVSSLEIDSDDVRMIGIKGIGGGGKTTLARAVFDYISTGFEGKSFVENVREVSKASGLKELQRHALSTVLNDQSIVVPSVSDGKNMMKKMMGNRKILLVLDDVDDIGQLEALAGEPTWFKTGSRIIITTRDEQVLKAHRVNFIHDVNLLSDGEAICLFSRYAFGREIPNQGYEELSRMVIHYAAGLPLTVKVLGSFLCDRIKSEWADAIRRLKTIPLKETLEKLELSFSGLENDQKEIFMDIACILKGKRKKEAIRILESRGFHAQIGLRVLVQKSLITFSKVELYDEDDVEKLFMHDHLEEMGRNIVRRLHPDEPSRHSRLWIKEEIEDILVNELGNQETKCIKLEDTDLNPAIIMKGLGKMKDLRFLYVNPGNFKREVVDDVSQYLPDSLQSLCWRGYPFCCLPKTFRANKLVNLEMARSNISQLWEGGERKVFNKLRFLDLSYSKLRTFDLTVTPHLKHLNFQGCKDFVELHMPVECSNLKFLNLSRTKVSNLNVGMIPYLKHLDLGECFDFVELQMPVECLNLKILHLSLSKVSNLNLGMTPHLEKLDLRGCADFVELHMPVECPNLKMLMLYMTKVGNLNLGMTPNLEKLDLDACNEFELHMPVECPNLIHLKIRGSKVSNLNLELIPNLEILDLSKCYCLLEIHAPVGCLEKLVYFSLDTHSNFKTFMYYSPKNQATSNIMAQCIHICPLHPNNKLPKFGFELETDEPVSSWMGNLFKLIYSGLCPCKNLECWSATICGLQHLRELELKGSIPGSISRDLWQLESLEKLSLREVEIQHLPDSIYMLKHLKSLEIRNCQDMEQLPEDICRLEC